MKQSKAYHASRIVLGLIMTIFGLNKFLNFIPMSPATESAGAAFGGMAAMGYLFPFLAITEISTGVLFLANRFTALAGTILMPVSLNIILFHLTHDVAGIVPGLVVFVTNFYVLWAQKDKFKEVLRP